MSCLGGGHTQVPQLARPAEEQLMGVDVGGWVGGGGAGGGATSGAHSALTTRLTVSERLS